MATTANPAASEACVDEFLTKWGPLSIFVGIILTGMGFPMPEELPVVVGGGLVHNTNPLDYRWWLMLVACILGVVVGDSFLYCIGRFWGVKLVRLPFVHRRILPPERLAKIESNFQEYGVKILLFARLTPGIRAGIFIVAGITKLPWAQFLLADGIYAIPGVTLLFTLGWWFTDNMVALIEQADTERRKVMPYVIVIGLLAVAAYFVYRHLRRPMVEGSPQEMPPVVEQVTNTVEKTVEKTVETVKDKILHPGHETKSGVLMPPAPSENGTGETGRDKSEMHASPSETKPKSE
jgi:membrane protein DedA with SNARE-associated domain